MTNKMTNREMLEQMVATMGTINSRLEGIEKRVDALEKVGKKPTTSAKAKPQATEKDTRSFREKKADWAKEKYTEEQRKAYGEQKRSEREKKHKAYEEANKCFKEKVDYKVWKAKYDEILATL